MDEYTAATQWVGANGNTGMKGRRRQEGVGKQALYTSFHVVSIPPTHCVCRSFTLHCVDRGIESSEKKIAAHILWSPPQLLL